MFVYACSVGVYLEEGLLQSEIRCRLLKHRNVPVSIFGERSHGWHCSNVEMRELYKRVLVAENNLRPF